MTFVLLGDWVSSARIDCIVHDVVLLLQCMANWYDQRADVICSVTAMSDQRSTFVCQVKHCSECALILRAMSAQLKVRCLTMRKHNTTSGTTCWNSSLCREAAQCYKHDLEDWELCRVALSCHFAVNVIYA